MADSSLRRGAGAAGLVVLALALLPGALRGQLAVASRGGGELEARVWLDRGDEPVLRTGDQVLVYYRATRDAYVSIFHIDTDGTTSLVFPRSPDEDHSVRGGRDYRLLFPRSPYWYVDDQPGLGYFFIIASPEPFYFSRFQFSRYDASWDLGRVGREVYRDPYVAMDDYIAALLPDWQQASYALDFAGYNVGQRFQYPRFLCYDCHGFRSYATWNPYYATCTGFRVVIYDDPYFYPARRYRVDRVVWARPGPDRPRYLFWERMGGEPGGPLVEPRSVMDMPGVVAPAPRRDPRNGAGGVAPSGVVRGRATPSTPSTEGSERDPSARPTDRARNAAPRGGVVAPAPGSRLPAYGADAPAAETPERRDAPGGGSAPLVDPRLRPILRKRPSDAATSAPEAGPASGTVARPAPAQPSGSSAPSTVPRACPRGEDAPTPRAPESPSPARERAPAVRRPPAGGSGSERARKGDREPPTVRTTPDGRPVIRRPGE
ncbi:MAG: DUF4384 domain-containing protein [Gemmatimonadetes bacterium]|nr:DUF4384 domain-containing protein [Gemmatimonadota bacterium]